MGSRIAIVAMVAAVLMSPQRAAAQAWVPSQGEGTIAVLAQDLSVNDHFQNGGQRVKRGHISTNTLLFDLTYGVTDKLALSLTVPYIRARYAGVNPHPSPQDNGSAHGGFQDLRFNVRYNIVDGPITITPFVGTNVPSHKYEYFAHAAYGPRVREVEFGAYVGRELSGPLQNAFVQARYSYGIPEKIAGLRPKHSNLDLEFGYFLTPTIRVFTLGKGHKTHGGIEVPDAGWRVMSPVLGPHHDRIGRIDLLDAGGGVQVSVTKSLDVFGSYMKSLAGRNSHALERAVTIGASWSFGGRSLGGLLAPTAPATPPSQSASASSDETPATATTKPQDTGATRRLVKCLCQK